MRIALTLLAGLLATVMPRSDATVAPVAIVRVQVDLQCSGTAVQFRVDPWVATLDQGDQVEWVLNPGSSTDTISIAPKNPGQWAFSDGVRHQGHKARPPRAARMKANQRGRRYAYNIELKCGGEAVVVDPIMIIR